MPRVAAPVAVAVAVAVAVVVVVVVVVLVFYFPNWRTKGHSSTRWAFKTTAGNQETAIGCCGLRGGRKPPEAG